MAKVLCAISGIEFQCEHLPIALHSREYAHPIFALPYKKLLGLYQKYRHNELTATESYLVYLAYLHQTDLVEWRVPVKRTPKLESIIANTFDSLVETCEKIFRIKDSVSTFSHIAVSADTCTLSTVAYWIAAWEETYDDFVSGYKNQKARQELADLEYKLDYITKDANRSELQFAARLAEWADKAGSFPQSQTIIDGKYVPLNWYWKQIIRKCTNSESIFSIPESDLAELLEHCEETIDAGSTYAFHLFKILREGVAKQKSFLGLGDFNFTILEKGDDSVEKANKLAIIANAPDTEPRRIDYPSNFQYIKAKLAWEMKQSATVTQEGEQNESSL